MSRSNAFQRELRHPPDVPERLAVCASIEYNSNIALCCDQVVVHPDFIFDTMGEIDDFECCGQRYYQPSKEICCEDKHIHFRVRV